MLKDYESKLNENKRDYKKVEESVLKQVVNFLKYQYPKIYYRVDAAAGMRMTIGQAMANKKIQKCRAWPDLFIAQPTIMASGLFIELKKSKDEVFTKNGSIKKDEHLNEQNQMLEILRELGYKAEFGCGFDHTIQLIRQYINEDL